MSDFITFDAPLKVDGLAKKLDEFNAVQDSETRLGEEEVKVVLGIARGLVRLSKENLAVLMKMQRCQTSQAFPLLDILRSGVRIGRIIMMVILMMVTLMMVNPIIVI